MEQSARIRASLFNLDIPLDFASTWLLEFLKPHKPKSLPIAITPTRELCVCLFESKIEATIKNLGDEIGWEGDGLVVGPTAAAAKKSILRLIPHIIPPENDYHFRFVLEHGDFGIHNMSIAKDADSRTLVTSVFDWDTASVVPAILTDPEMAVIVDLQADENASRTLGRVDDDDTPEKIAEWMTWAKQYLDVSHSLKSFEIIWRIC